MKTVKQVLDAKGHDIWSVTVDDSVFAAIQMMAEKRVGALLVMDDGKPVGVISERDYARKVILQGRSSHETRIKEIMTTEVIYTAPTRSIEECMALMTEKRIRHLPVIDGPELLGIISLGDLVKHLIDDQRFTIEQLERYISG